MERKGSAGTHTGKERLGSEAEQGSRCRTGTQAQALWVSLLSMYCPKDPFPVEASRAVAEGLVQETQPSV
jgi:hypothetical protein